MNGYDLANEVFHNIGNEENHEISLQDAVRAISFFGFNEEAENGTIGFVCRAARDKVKKCFEQALVYGDYSLFNDLVEEIQFYNELIKKYEEQKPCGDVISRQAVLDQIDLWRKDEFLRVTNPFDYLYKRINFLPPVTLQQTRWIPVSERLPAEFESVLVCYKSQGGMVQCVSERIVNIDGGSRWSAMYGQKPIAWMPLPEPYKAESEDKE